MVTLNRFIQDPIARAILELLTRTSKIRLGDLYVHLRLHGFHNKVEIAESLKALDRLGKITIQYAHVMKGVEFRK